MNGNRFLALLSCTALLSVVVAGCSQGSSSGVAAPTSGETKTSQTDTKPAELKTLTLLTGTTGTAYPALQVVAAEAEKKLNIKIKFDIKPDGTEGDNLVKTRLATGEMSDILFYNSGSLFQALNPEENFVDLTKEPYMEKLLDSYKQTVSANGKVFGVPGGSSNVGGILYNKRVYKELGLSIPKTWAEFIANSDKIKASGKTAVIGSYKTTWTSQLYVLANHYNVQAQNPTFVQDYTANKAKYATTPSALRGFEMTAETFKKGYMNKDFLATTYDNALKMLAEGTGVQYPMLTSAIDALAQNYPDKIKDIGVFPVPSDNASINGFTVWLPNSLYINKKSKNVDAAKKFLDFLISPEGMKLYMTKSKANGPYVIKGINVPDDAYDAIKEMQSYFDAGTTGPALEFVSPVKGPNLESLLIEVGTGQKSAADGAADYDKDVKKQAQQLNLPGW
ncbi:ABC transporter substrate-binding protein [Paenibacillus aceris]|uniref:Raffinose/stachyose/melibiose transport system substrate-binding protein n=1 Tax=Paenibacillus aceris TaxID=869555 RepID=A0ABS4HX19_9BACL|nr:ABC transporter substrate-binding protein [Paenibacillus aceris]MBP1962906.1 raffinose/stachyose/melibiose transport system substrate-binding protein [Paenibacillus aceris]NHW38333.1 carbohydrate ABC transporter substrate-binding protein [Paenibacillus aceris]